MERFYNKGFSIEERVEELFGRVCFYHRKGKGSPLKYQNPLHPKDVDPKDKKQVERCIKDQIAYAECIASGPTSPFNHPLVIRTHRE